LLISYDSTNTTQQTWNAALDATAEITGVDRDTGTITTNKTTSGASTVSTGDLIFVNGDRNSKLSGLAAWIPSVAPGATPFFGVDRTIDVTRLGGIRVASTGKPLDEALIDAARRCGREDVEIAGIAFRGIKISGPKGPITVFPDQDCPDNKMYMLEMDTLGLYSLKEPVMLIDLDGTKMLREASADAFEVRCSSYAQVGCTMPGHNAVLNF